MWREQELEQPVEKRRPDDDPDHLDSCNLKHRQNGHKFCRKQYRLQINRYIRTYDGQNLREDNIRTF